MAPSDNLFEQEGLFEGREGENSEPVKVSDKEFDRIVKRAIHRIPEELREHLDNVLISVRKRASQEMLEEMDVPPGKSFSGFFQAFPLWTSP